MPVATLLNAVTSNTTGPVLGIGTPAGTLTLAVSTTGTVSGFSVQLQGSLDGTQWEMSDPRHVGDRRDERRHRRAAAVLPGTPVQLLGYRDGHLQAGIQLRSSRVGSRRPAVRRCRRGSRRHLPEPGHHHPEPEHLGHRRRPEHDAGDRSGAPGDGASGAHRARRRPRVPADRSGGRPGRQGELIIANPAINSMVAGAQAFGSFPAAS